MISATCVVVDESKCLDIPIWEFSIILEPASAACPEHPGSLNMMFMTFAAVMFDSDDPCLVNTA